MSKHLKPEEVQEAVDVFFPLFDIVASRMPPSASVEDTIKIMESVCTLAMKLRATKKEEEAEKFGFNKLGQLPSAN